MAQAFLISANNYKYPTHETKIDNYITKPNSGYCKL